MAKVQDLGGQYGHRGTFTPRVGGSNTPRRWKAPSSQMRTVAHRATIESVRPGSRPVSRVLCAGTPGGITGAAVISLGSPVTRDLERPTRGSAGRLISPYLALLRVGFAWPVRYRTAGGLLPRRCTLTGPQAIRRYVSVALSLGSPPLGITQHPALRSPDFPRRSRAATARPAPGHMVTRSDRGSSRRVDSERILRSSVRRPRLYSCHRSWYLGNAPDEEADRAGLATLRVRYSNGARGSSS